MLATFLNYDFPILKIVKCLALTGSKVKLYLFFLLLRHRSNFTESRIPIIGSEK